MRRRYIRKNSGCGCLVAIIVLIFLCALVIAAIFPNDGSNSSNTQDSTTVNSTQSSVVPTTDTNVVDTPPANTNTMSTVQTTSQATTTQNTDTTTNNNNVTTNQTTSAQVQPQATKPITSTPVTTKQSKNTTTPIKISDNNAQTQSQGGGNATTTGVIDYWRADLHSGPNKDSGVIERDLGKGTQVTILGYSGRYAYVIVNNNGDKGYVYEKFIH